MAISFVGASTVAGGTSGVTIPTWPSGIADGDVALLLVECANDTVEIPGGWNYLVDPNDGAVSNPGTGTASGASSTKLAVYWRRYNTADGAIGSLDGLAANHIIAAILAYRGVESVGLCFDDIATDVEASSTTAVTFPAVTTSVANCWIVNAGSDTTDSTSTTRIGSWANASLSSVTERLDGGNGSGNGGGVWAADGELVSAGSSGSTTATLASASQQARVTIALRPDGSYSAPGGPTVSVTTGGTAVNATSFSVTLPATVNAGDVLCVAMAVDGSPTLTWDNSTAGTWTQRVNTGAVGSVRLAVFTKTADGTEDGLTLSIGSSASEAASWAVYRIEGVTGDIELSTVTQFSTGTTRHIRPAAQLTPSWGKTNTLWVGFAGHDAAQVITLTPPMFTTATTQASTGSGGGSVVHSHLVYDAISMDWGGVYLGAAEDFVAVLMAFEPAASSGYTLSADAAAFSWTPAAATLRAARKVTASPASLAWTPQAATLRPGRRGVSDAAAWVWTPQAATLRLTRRLVTSAAAFAWTPQAASLEKGHRLVADAVSWVWTAQDADLIYGELTGYILTAEAAAFDWTPAAASLRLTRRIEAVAASFAWTAQDADLRRTLSYTLAADPAAWAWTPQDAQLRAARKVVGSAAAFSWTPAAANLIPARCISAEAASWLWTPQDASLLRTQKLTASPASWIWTAQPAALRRAVIMSAAAASFAWTPAAATLTRTRSVRANPAAFLWTAQNADLVYVVLGEREILQIPVVNNLEQLRKRANVILELLQTFLPGFAGALPDAAGHPEGKFFVNSDDQSLWQKQGSDWSLVSGGSLVMASVPISQTADSGDEVPYATEVFDRLGEYDPTTYTFTPTRDGQYRLHAMVFVSNLQAGKFGSVEIAVNGVRAALSDLEYNDAGSPRTASFGVSRVLSLAATDAVTFRVSSDNGVAFSLFEAPYSFLEIEQV